MRSPPSESHTSSPISPLNDDRYTSHLAASNMYSTKTNSLQLLLNKIKKKLHKFHRMPFRMKILTFFILMLLSFALINGLMIIGSGVSSWMNAVPPLIIGKLKCRTLG